MTKDEMLKKLKDLNDELMYLECADLRYDFYKANKVKEEIESLEKALKEMEG